MARGPRRGVGRRTRVVIILVTVVACAAIAVPVGIAWVGPFIAAIGQRTVDSQSPPDSRLRVDFIETDGPVFFGPSDVRVVLRDDGKERARVDETLSNDGKMLDASNWQVRWIEGGVVATLLGEEQTPDVCTLLLDGSASCVPTPTPTLIPIPTPTPTPTPTSTPIPAPTRTPTPEPSGVGLPTATPGASKQPQSLNQQLAEAPEYADARRALGAVAKYVGKPVTWDLDRRAGSLGVLDTTSVVKNGYTYRVRDVVGLADVKPDHSRVIRVREFINGKAPRIDDELVGYYDVDAGTDVVTEVG